MPGPLSLIFYYRPIGKYALNVLSAALENDSFCRALPLHFAKNQAELIQLIVEARQYSDNVAVFWTFYSPQFLESTRELQSLKHRPEFSRVLHVAGGPHASAEPEQVLQAGFDFAACGEGEQLITELCLSLSTGTPALGDIKGLCYRNGNQILKNGRGFIPDLNAYLPGSAMHRKFGPIEITRGCIYACKFCQTPYVNKAKFRHRSVDSIVSFAATMRDHGLRDYRFISPSSLSYGSYDTEVNHDALEELLARMRDIIGPQRRLFFGTFPSEARPEHIDHNILEILKRHTDNDNIIIGAQSGSQTVLDNCSRGHRVDDVLRASRLCLEHGLRPHIDFLLGLPGEEDADRKASLKLAEKLSDMGAKIHLHSFMPLPGTPFRHSHPVELDAKSRNTLNRLSSSGKAYGQWQTQEKHAVALSTLKQALEQK